MTTTMSRSRRSLTASVCPALCATGLMAAARPAPAAGSAGSAPGTQATVPIYLNTNYSPAERAADLVSRMTLAEKIAQLHTNSAPAIPPLGGQQYTHSSEGQHRIN